MGQPGVFGCPVTAITGPLAGHLGGSSQADAGSLLYLFDQNRRCGPFRIGQFAASDHNGGAEQVRRVDLSGDAEL